MNMSEDLLRLYPDVYEPDPGPQARDLEIQAGWMPLVSEYCERLRTLKIDTHLRWCKEKFGSLRVHSSSDRHLSRLQQQWLDMECERARRKSLTICQECGQPGRLRIGLHYSTLCDQHAQIVGDRRPEDGRILDPDRQRIVSDRVVLVRRNAITDLPDAALGLDEAATWDAEKAFLVQYLPMLFPGAVLPQTDRELAMLGDKLMQVDVYITMLPGVDFWLHAYRPGEKTDFSISIPDEYDDLAIRDEIGNIMKDEIE